MDGFKKKRKEKTARRRLQGVSLRLGFPVKEQSICLYLHSSGTLQSLEKTLGSRTALTEPPPTRPQQPHSAPPPGPRLCTGHKLTPEENLDVKTPGRVLCIAATLLSQSKPRAPHHLHPTPPHSPPPD